MLNILGNVKGKQYDVLIDYMLKECDVFTFCLPNFGKQVVISQKIQDIKKSSDIIIDCVEYLDGGSEFAKYKKKVLPRMNKIYDHKLKVYYSVKYGSSLYGSEREIYIIRIDSSLDRTFFKNKGLFDWRFPKFPEDLCFYKSGKCFMETVAHEQLCFFYSDDKEIQIFLDSIGVGYCETVCHRIPLLED